MCCLWPSLLVKSGEGGTNEQIVLEEMTQEIVRLGTCQKLAGGKGVETEGRSQLFETAEKVGGGGVMKNGPLKGGGSCKYMSVIMWRFTHRRKKKLFIL